MQNQDITKFEFILTLENNIVIQRFFNVSNYNPESKNSLDLYKIVTEICEDISLDLKRKTLSYMENNMDFITDTQREEERNNFKEEYFLLQIKLGEKVFISRVFPAHIYHPKARYAVDIRPNVKQILSDLTDVLSSTKLNKSYLQYELR
jgi:hypothetical protein